MSGTARDFFPEIVAGSMECDPEEEPGTPQQLSAGLGEGVEGVREQEPRPFPQWAPRQASTGRKALGAGPGDLGGRDT